MTSELHPRRGSVAIFVVAAVIMFGQGVNVAAAAQAGAPTTTTLTLAPNPSVAGQNVTFTAEVTGEGPGTPSGTVQFLEFDDTPIGEAQPLVAGKAHFVAWAYTGRYLVKARYSGDDTFTPSVGTFTQTVNRADTETTLFTEPNPVEAGGKLTLDVYVATVEPGYVRPGGSVSILLNGTDISGPVSLFALDDLTAGVRLRVTAPNVPGSGALTAVYSGDAETTSSISSSVTQVVSPGVTPTPTPAPSVSPTPTATPTPAPTSSPRATTRAALTTMTEPLLRTLRRRGLHAARSVRQTLTVNAPGVLSQLVYSPPAPRSTSALRAPILVARASRRFATAGTGILQLRLTAAGRRLAGRAGKLRLQVVTTFTPTVGQPITTSSRVTSSAPRTIKAGGRLRAWPSP